MSVQHYRNQVTTATFFQREVCDQKPLVFADVVEL